MKVIKGSNIEQKGSIFKRILFFYIDGFRSMTIGRTLWAIIILKLFIMFAILKVFFFPDILESKFDNDNDRSNYVRQELLNR